MKTATSTTLVSLFTAALITATGCTEELGEPDTGDEEQAASEASGGSCAPEAIVGYRHVDNAELSGELQSELARRTYLAALSLVIAGREPAADIGSAAQGSVQTANSLVYTTCPDANGVDQQTFYFDLYVSDSPDGDAYHDEPFIARVRDGHCTELASFDWRPGSASGRLDVGALAGATHCLLPAEVDISAAGILDGSVRRNPDATYTSSLRSDAGVIANASVNTAPGAFVAVNGVSSYQIAAGAVLTRTSNGRVPATCPGATGVGCATYGGEYYMSHESIAHDRIIRDARAQGGWIAAVERATEDDAMELMVQAFGGVRNDIFNHRAKAGRAKFIHTPWTRESDVQAQIDSVYPVEPDMSNVRAAFGR